MQNRHLGHPQEKCTKPRLAFHLGLQDFSRQAGHSGARLRGDAIRLEGAAFVIYGRSVGVRGSPIRSGRGAILFGSSLAVGGNSFDLDAQLALKLKEIGALFAQKECRGDAAFSGAAGAADAMDEVFGDIRQIVVDDMRDVLNVDAASGDVGGYQDAVLPALKAGEGGGPLRLRAVAMNHRGVDALAVETLVDAFGAALGARENKATAAFVVEQIEEHVWFAVFQGNFEGLGDEHFAGKL